MDGCRGGWVGVRLSPDGRLGWVTASTVHPFLAAAADGSLSCLAIDIPLGLSDGPARECDRAARRRLTGRGSSVFAAPTRSTAQDWREGVSHAEAVARARARGHPAPSRQTWNITARVVEVDRALRTDHQGAVVECHPEVSFRELDPRVRARKVTVAGVAQRIAALSGWIDPLQALASAPDGVPMADALDALGCAWTALRVRRGDAQQLGDPSQRDRSGRPLLIWV